MDEMAFVDFCNAVFRGAASQVAASRGREALVDCMIYRPTIFRRNEIRWIAVHNWRTGRKAAGVEALKQLKLAASQEALDAAARPIAALMRELFGDGPADAVSCVPCGHSRRADCFGKRLARAAAAQLRVPFVQIFEDQPRAGSSHPKQSINLPPLQQLVRPPRSVLIIDDVATSGRHLEEAVLAVRKAGASASAVAWVSGAAKGGEPIVAPERARAA